MKEPTPPEDPTFPNYPNPGLRLADPGEAKPLKKLISKMFKSPKMRDPFHSRRPKTRKMKKVSYY